MTTGSPTLQKWAWGDPSPFWTFCAARDALRQAKQAGPPPWTNDPVLANVKFTNVFRALDRGTQFVVAEVMETPASLQSRVAEQLVYRWFNNIPTHQHLRSAGAFTPGRPNIADLVYAVLKDRRYQGEKLYTGAYIATYCPDMGTGGDKERDAALVVESLVAAAPGVAALIAEVRPQVVVVRLKRLPGIGDFLAWQMAADWTHPTLIDGRALLRSNWALPGPGAYKGAALLGVPRRDVPAAMVALAELGPEQCAAAGVEPPAITRRDGGRVHMSVVDVEHALCEMQKYVRAKAGGATKGRYAPSAAPRSWEPRGPTIPAYDGAEAWELPTASP
jgi:hypothetical protein